MTDITVRPFGEHQGQAVQLFTLTNRQGMMVSVTDYGCTVTAIHVPDRHGIVADVVLGFDRFESYQAGHPFFGAIAGRCANRIANGQFTIEGASYTLTCNEVQTGQHLHGGAKGFDKYVWQAEIEKDAVLFSRVSEDGEEGYPGKLVVKHRIKLSDDNVLTYDFWAQTDTATPVNLVNHCYYNLAGHDKNINDHYLQIAADFITPVASDMIPTGEIAAVAHTHYDFRHLAHLGQAMSHGAQFDTNYVLRGDTTVQDPKALHHAATLLDPQSGRQMEVFTNQPGLQFYNGSKLSNKEWYGKDDVRYLAFSGLCLETQDFPNSVNTAHFPNVVLQPSETYHRITEHRFSII